jgi:hypothetical protein
MSVVEADFGDAQEQSALFELPPLEKGGAITLSAVKAVPLEHADTANLLKSPHMGHGTRITGSFAGIIAQHTAGKGLITWTVQVDELEVEI